jgi:hypothetical protein
MALFSILPIGPAVQAPRRRGFRRARILRPKFKPAPIEVSMAGLDAVIRRFIENAKPRDLI